FITGNTNGITLYRAKLVPITWFLGKRFTSRVFQNLSVLEIIEEKFDQAGIQTDQFEFLTNENHPTREFCVQYQETDIEFVHRLMEEEGLFYYYRHEDDNHMLVISDHLSSHQALNSPEKPFREQSSMVSDERTIYQLHIQQNLSESHVSLRDYDFRKPNAIQQASAFANKDVGLEHYCYPGKFGEQDDAERKARVLLEQKQSMNSSLHIQSVCGDLVPGSLLKIRGHELVDASKDYLITSVVHSGKQPQAMGALSTGGASTYNNRATLIPGDVPFRARYESKKPIILTTQTATVVGPESEDIYTDEFGRVKLQFQWDRQGQYDENSSCWVRVSQVWAGAGWGSFSLPRVGQEVIVQFIDGDPDKPIITGSLYHATRTTAYALPENKSKTVFRTNSTPDGGGFNELSFEDKKGEENIYFHAERNLEQRINSDQLEWVGNDSHSIIKNDRITLIEGDQHQTLMGDSYSQIDGDVSFQVGADYQFKNDADYAHESGGDVHIKAGSKLILEAGSEITIKVGGSFLKIDGSGITQLGSSIKLNSGGSAGSGKGVAIDEPIEALDAGMREAAQSPEPAPKPEAYSPAAMTLKQAASDGAATVSKCEGA
ncbi:MAG: type VI secretion system tip protein VgrG, partial [Gammaproteobacteria bacterium]|nr:type VI secretion system tip protein VgrG [Gammaproteobacteria bacterium]